MKHCFWAAALSAALVFSCAKPSPEGDTPNPNEEETPKVPVLVFQSIDVVGNYRVSAGNFNSDTQMERTSVKVFNWEGEIEASDSNVEIYFYTNEAKGEPSFSTRLVPEGVTYLTKDGLSGVGLKYGDDLEALKVSSEDYGIYHITIDLKTCTLEAKYLGPPTYVEPEVPDEPTDEFNLNPEGKKFPILGYGCPRDNRQAYLDMAECGFTLCIPERINIERHLSSSAGSGVKIVCFVFSEMSENSDEVTLKSYSIDLIKKNKNNPQVAMWEFCDEPITVDKDWNVAKLRNAVAKIRALDDTHPIFLNWGAVQNNQYWDSSMSEFYSFDHYPLKYYDQQVKENNWYYDTYYGRTWTRWVNDNVEACKLAYKNNTYWNGMAASMRFSGICPEVEERHLRLAQFGNLACGAQMLSYYRYMESYQSDGRTLKDYEGDYYYDINGVKRDYPTGKQHGAPVTYNNEKNPSWQMVKNVNDEINSLAGLFLGMRVETASVLNSDWKGNVRDGVAALQSFNNFPSNLKITVPSDERLLVSRFTNKGHTYIMCLNYWCKLDVHPTLSFGSNVLRIFSDVKAEPVEEGKISVTLAPGEYLIYRVL